MGVNVYSDQIFSWGKTFPGRILLGGGSLQCIEMSHFNLRHIDLPNTPVFITYLSVLCDADLSKRIINLLLRIWAIEWCGEGWGEGKGPTWNSWLLSGAVSNEKQIQYFLLTESGRSLISVWFKVMDGKFWVFISGWFIVMEGTFWKGLYIRLVHGYGCNLLKGPSFQNSS